MPNIDYFSNPLEMCLQYVSIVNKSKINNNIEKCGCLFITNELLLGNYYLIQTFKLHS